MKIQCTGRQQATIRGTYMWRSSHAFGNDLAGERITPMFAAPSSFARRCASAAPIMVTLSVELSLLSTSAFRAIMDAMMSALNASATSGISPCALGVSMHVHMIGC